jgi:hypothetical protein
MFMDARINLLGVMNELDIRLSRAQAPAQRYFSVEAFCNKYLLKEFSDTRLRCVVTKFTSGPTDPSSMALSAAAMAGPESRPEDFRSCIRPTLPGSVDPNHGLEEIQIDKLLGIRVSRGID